MANEAAKTQTINIVPVQGIFEPEPTFDLITLIGPAGTPFFAKINPNQSGLNITNSTINSTTIGAITPSTGVFTNIATTTGTIASTPSSPTDIVNKQYVDYFAAGLSWKQPANAASTVNIVSLSGLQTVDTVALVAGNTVLVKNQTNAADNGIYVVSSGPWTRSIGADTWDEYIGAIIFIVSGTQADSAWYSTAQPGGTLGVTAINWSNFTVSAIYTAGTGLTLTGTVFSITPVGTAGTYGSASAVPVFVTNASGQVSSVTNTPIAIANTQVSGLGTMSTQNDFSVAITGGTINGTTIGGSTAAAVTGTIVTANTYFSGAGTNLTGTASGLSIGGNAATATSATSATTATNLAGGASGSLPYQSAPSTTTFLAAGSNGQVLTLASGVPSWATPTTGTVTSVGTAGTVNGLTLTGGPITTSGTITLGGTLDLSAPPTIGNTTPNTGRFTTLTVDDNATFGTNNTDTINFVGRINSDFDPATDNTYDLGRVGHEWRNLYIDGTANIDSLIADTADINAGTIDNTSIGLTIAAAGYFTTLSLTSTLAVNGSTGTNGQVLQSNGSSAPTWVTPSSYATVTDDTTTNATRYPLYADQTTGNLTTEFVSSTKLQFNPSTGVFTSTSFSGAGTGLTGTATSLSIGGNAATATSATSATTATNIAGGVANQIPYQTGVGATSFITAPTTSSTVLTWNGSAFAWSAASGGLTISDDTTTNATRYLTFTSATTGTITSENVSSTKLTFNPSTGILASTGFSGPINGSIGATTPSTGVFTDVNTPNTFGFKNRIINGAMVIDQRNAGAAITTGTGFYSVDRWNVIAQTSAKITVQQNAGSVTPPVGFSNYLGVTVGASANVTLGATDQYLLRQGIEGFNMADLAWGTASAASIAISFWVRSSLTGTFGGTLHGGGGGSSYSYPFSFSIGSANTWTKISVNIAGQTAGTWTTNNTLFTWVSFDLGVGSTYSGTANAWANTYYSGVTGAVKMVETNSATFYVTGVQLEKGLTATSFDYKPYGTELALCQRYFYNIVGNLNPFAGLGSGVVTGLTTARVYIKYPVNARTSPTVSFGGVVYVYDGGNGTVTSVAINAGDQSCSVDFTCSGGGITIGRGCVPNTANASTDFLQFSAEL